MIRSRSWLFVALTLAVCSWSLQVDARPSRTRAVKAYPTARRTLSKSFVAPAKGRVKIAFFDADSTLRVSKSGSPTADGVRDVAILPKAAQKINALAKQGYLIAVVSNQGGIAAGYVTDKVADGALRHTFSLLGKKGAPVHYYDYAAGNGKDRKPGSGMGERLAQTVRQLGKQIDWKNSIMVGDAGYKRGVDVMPNGQAGQDFSNSDRRFADNLRKKVSKAKGALTYHHPADYFGWTQAYGVRNIRSFAELGALLE